MDQSDLLSFFGFVAAVLMGLAAIGIGAYLGYRRTRWLFPAPRIPPNPVRMRQKLLGWGFSSVITFSIALGAEMVLGVTMILIALTAIALVYSVAQVLVLLILSKRESGSRSRWGKQPPHSDSP
jgi:vacuolar-type H+-ATPase subunit I/STV1